MTLFRVLLLVVALTSVLAATPTSRPAGQEAKKPPRQVAVTLLRPITEVRGVQWQREADGKPWLSTGVEETCDVKVQLPDGTVYPIRTRPRLVLSQTDGECVTDVTVPPDEPPVSMRENVKRLEARLKGWGLTPKESLKEEMSKWAERDLPPGRGYNTLRGHMDICKHIALMVEIHSAGDIGWVVVITFGADLEARRRLRDEAAGEPLSQETHEK